MASRPPATLVVFSVFFAFGAAMSGMSALLLVRPGTSLDRIWMLNLDARAQLTSLGPWGILLMAAVCAACALAAIGVWGRAQWGRRLAIGILLTSLAGDVVSAIVRSDPRPLIGVAVAGAMIAYLLSRGARREFAALQR